MKITSLKRILILLIFLVFTLSIYPFKTTYAEEGNPNVYAPSVILMDQDSGKILYEKNAHEQRFPASTTKLLTAILTVENCNLDDIVKVSYNAVMSVPYSYSNAALKVDEELTVNELLHALLIPSANDAANALAEHISGSVESFANMMNTKAKEIGCENTHFVNANGIHNESHYSTAYDLCLIAKYASQYDTIKQIACKTTYTLPTTNKYTKEDRILDATNCLLKTSYPKYYYENANGLKTGYTTEAKDCIIATATKDNKNLICVVLGANKNENGIAEKYLDCKELFNYGFNNYTKKTFVEKGDIVDTINVKGSSLNTRFLELEAESNISVLNKNSDNNYEYKPQIILKHDLSAPINAGEIVGTVSYEVDGITYSSNLIAKNNVEKSSIIMIVFRILLIILILLILYYALNATRNNKGRKSKNNRKRYKNVKYISRYR